MSIWRNFTSLTAPEVVIMTTSDEVSEENFVKITFPYLFSDLWYLNLTRNQYGHPHHRENTISVIEYALSFSTHYLDCPSWCNQVWVTYLKIGYPRMESMDAWYVQMRCSDLHGRQATYPVWSEYKTQHMYTIRHSYQTFEPNPLKHQL